MRKHALFPYLCLGLTMSIGSSLANTGISSQDLTLSSQQLSSATSGRDMNLNDVTIDGHLTAGRNLNCQRCTVSGNISVGHDLQLEQCGEVQNISSGHDASVTNTTVLTNMAVGHNLTLDHAPLEGTAHIGNEVFATNSTIKGPLSLNGNFMKLDHSATGDITFAQPSGTFITGTGSVIIQHSSSANVRVGANSLTNLNGYTVKGASNQTTLITPEQTIYVNGAKVSGEGPKTYEQYRQAHPGAPTIQGPGWIDNPTVVDKPRTKPIHDKPQSRVPVNTIDLTNQSRIDGDVIFDSGYGRVILHPGSQLNGKIVNGRVEHVSN
jgi:hypothetical protein